MFKIFKEAKKWHEKYERELETRKQAEKLLEAKTSEIYFKNQDILEAKNRELSKALEELQVSDEELRQSIEELASSNEELSRIQTLLIDSNKALQDSERSLEQKVKERTQELEEANRVKSEFLANMSHELRTPLNAILGYAQILLNEKEIPEKSKEKIAIINKSGTHLLGLINAVLDLSKIDAGKMELQNTDFNLGACLKQIFDMFTLQCEKKGIQFQFDVIGEVPNFTHADESKLRQCLINLIGNAVKFTAAGFVKLIVSKQQSGDIVRFEVSDTGRGIPTDKIEKILEPFTQIQSHQDTEGGTGLGLAITKKFIELMQGSLQVSSTEGVGSQFSFEIPLVKIDSPYPITTKEKKIIGYQADKAIKVLIVDDNSVNRLLVRDIIEPLGFQYEMAEDGSQAIDKAISYLPDIILMDIRMPGINGLQATEIIRKIDLVKEIKIIAVTANAFEQDKAEYLSKGCNGFVPKPFNTEVLLSEMKKLLNLEYLYEEELPIGATVESSRESYTLQEIRNSVPIELLQSFENELLLGKVESMKQIISTIPSTSEKVEAFKKDFLNLIQAFDFETIETKLAGILAE